MSGINDFFYNLVLHLPAIVIAFSLHEYAHARMAFALGDDTAARLGRLTLSPVRHIDPLGLLLIIVFGFGWAKPVPVNPVNFRSTVTMRQGMMLTAAAGPLTNLLLAVAGSVLLRFSLPLLFADGGQSILAEMLYYFVNLNVLLMVFNLLPVPPLDGFRVLSGVLPRGADPLLNLLERGGWVFLVVLLATDLPKYVISPVISAISDFILNSIAFRQALIENIVNTLAAC
ncbi:MAG: site-2 protease family protein [Gracilibacteraceae bacterium]|nr:site-2 protease family protein [Gracilibacteraceae bacterium]